MAKKTSRKRKIESSVKINVSQDKQGPVVCSFPGGMPAALDPLTTRMRNSGAAADDDTPTFWWRKHQDHTEVIGRDATCLYTSKTPRVEKRQTKMAVGVYDKQTGVLTLVPAASDGRVYALGQSVPSYQCSTKSQTQNIMTGEEHRRALFAEFGSSKKQKVLRSQEANKVNVDAVLGAGSAMVDGFMSGKGMSESNRAAIAQQDPNDNDAKVESSVEAATREWRLNFLPPFDEAADRPEEVYSIKLMIGTEAWSYTHRVVTACLASNDVVAALLLGPQRSNDENPEPGTESPMKKQKPQEWIKSVKALVEKQNAAQGGSVSTRLKAAMICNYWCLLYRQLQHRRFIPEPSEGRGRFFGVPLACAKRWLEAFGTPTTRPGGGDGGYIMSKAQKQKCVLFLLVLYVIASDGKLMKAENIKPLVDDLSIDIKEAAELLRQAGFTVKRKAGSGKATVSLKVPLKFPAPKRQLARKK